MTLAELRRIEDIGLLLTPTLVHGAITLAFATAGVALAGPLRAALAFALGIFLWTLGEYLVHRFIEHGPWRKGRAEYVDNHALHHASPLVARHFVYPLKLTLPALAATVAFYALVFRDAGLTLATSAGVTLSYLLNEWVHFTAHRAHLRASSRLLRWITRGHLRHHEEDPRKHFGFFTTAWDRVFFTR